MTTHAQTEARAIAQRLMLPDEDVLELAVDIIATALAAKDAEMVAMDTVAQQLQGRIADLTIKLEDAEAQLAEARNALERIEVRTRSVPSDTAGDDKRDKYHANSIARRAIETQGGE